MAGCEPCLFCGDTCQKKKKENGHAQTNISSSYQKEKADKQRMSNCTEKYSYMCIEKLLEKKVKSERKYIMITTLKQILSQSFGRKEKTEKKEKEKTETNSLLL